MKPFWSLMRFSDALTGFPDAMKRAERVLLPPQMEMELKSVL